MYGRIHNNSKSREKNFTELVKLKDILTIDDVINTRLSINNTNHDNIILTRKHS